ADRPAGDDLLDCADGALEALEIRLAMVGGGVDYILKIIAPDIDAYQRLVDGLLDRELGIDRYFTYIVTKTVKEDTVLPVSYF
ncbi:Lrp/AsnC ligand binding domain-containing protein, partial [Rhizobium johnstonii]|uniref:Lrp/AsnC ligand binding domain-containing protein n=1 Tax=Rhizobium johnstonii TaxID=3019933 RepID=UPI003F9EA8AA